MATPDKKKKYGQWSVEEMEMAIGAIERGDMGLNRAAKLYGVPKATLQRHLKNKNKIVNGTTKYHGGFSCLGDELEKDLADHCLNLEQRFFGLTKKDIRKLAFEIAEANKISHNFNRTNGLAGEKWFRGFMKRHPELSLREPESTSIARAQGFNKARVQSFFDLISSVYEEFSPTPNSVWNMDETSLSTVPFNQAKVIGQKGKKQIGALVSQERGESATCVMACNATGNYLPPMVIFKRVRMKAEMCTNGPPGTVYACQEKGWMSNEGFILWLKHFIDTVHPTREKPVILILDGHVSHTKNYEALTLAKTCGVVMVSLPPHCTHRLQPLDVSFFGPFKKAYDSSIRSWHFKNPGRAITSWQFAELLHPAFTKSATIENAVSGFRASGIWPLDSSVFKDGNFAPSYITDKHHNNDVQLIATHESDVDAAQPMSEPSASHTHSVNQPAKSHGHSVPVPDENNNIMVNAPLASSSTENNTDGFSAVRASDITPLPHMSPVVKKRRGMSTKAAVLTSSPYLMELAGRKEEGKKARKTKPTSKEKISKKPKKRAAKRQAKTIDDPEPEVSAIMKETINLSIGLYVSFEYEDEIFPGQITDIENDEFTIKAMKPSGRPWKWPKVDDVMNYPREDLKEVLSEPIELKRGVFRIKEMEAHWE